ncbi:aminodeoxychorismate/anthranilate synthase component II [Bowmanella sp. JS7-9]|uniref:anthranilate synthase n=1 Tax=Pseudobowmanella zhangzhouensis TaxID=1537679 RepID=A0ABW1XK95_9ALTE|nr:aminodeoxychorismate/anthranilate synthase component II [Bowmanella sp. JS7-9]TBX22460.1 anthranilate synthase subunit II [Bowmanella sp. JS7-9]
MQQSQPAIELFLLDNIDSFSYNLVDEMRKLGYPMTVYRNHVSATTIMAKMREAQGQPILILSPGPGAPADAGCMPELLKQAEGQFPVLGICLGHQAIVQHYGGDVIRASEVMHGKASHIEHCGDAMFAGLPQPLPVARYHSLMAANMPACLRQLASFNGIPMAVYHDADKMLGFQFHPESILTSHGSQLLKQSIDFLAGGGQ